MRSWVVKAREWLEGKEVRAVLQEGDRWQWK